MLKDIQVPNVNVGTDGVINKGFFTLYRLDTRLSIYLREIKQIKLDLFIARDSFVNINRLEDCEQNYFLKHSLWFSGAMTYCRCFNSGKRNLKLGKYINRLEPKLKDAHFELMKQRNKYIAHADTNEFERCEVFGVLDMEGKELIGVSNYYDKIFALNPEMIKNYEELLCKVIDLVAKEEDRRMGLLLDELSQMKIDERNVINPSQTPSIQQQSEFNHMVGYLFCEENKDYTNGLRFMNKAIQLTPNNPDLYVNRSNVYEALNDYKNYKKDLLQALETDKDHAIAKGNYQNLIKKQADNGAEPHIPKTF